MTFDGLLNKTANIKRLIGDTDRYGNTEKTYNTVYNDIPIRIDQQTGQEVEIDNNITLKRARAYTRKDGILAQDIIEVDNNIYEVISHPILRQRTKTAHHYEIDIEQRNI